jgi:hypothetical protein
MTGLASAIAGAPARPSPPPPRPPPEAQPLRSRERVECVAADARAKSGYDWIGKGIAQLFARDVRLRYQEGRLRPEVDERIRRDDAVRRQFEAHVSEGRPVGECQGHRRRIEGPPVALGRKDREFARRKVDVDKMLAKELGTDNPRRGTAAGRSQQMGKIHHRRLIDVERDGSDPKVNH